MNPVLVGGGSRSGKSRQALSLARRHGSRLAFVATAELLDAEMQQRAAAHQAERGRAFTTFEEPLALPELVSREGGNFDAVVIDCLTVWLSNLILSGGKDWRSSAQDLLQASEQCQATVLLVSNEVGCGIVPDNPLARQFRDAAGSLNQMAAAGASEVYWMAFGIPLRVK